MTVQEICDKLQEYFSDNYKAAVEDQASFITDIFPESLTPAFTEDIILELQGRVAQGSTTVGDGVGIQEALAFIGALQRNEACRKGNRMTRLLGGYNFRKNLSDDEGPVGLQLRHIGVKTGDEFTDKLEGTA